MCSFNDSLLVVTSPHKLQEYKIFTDTDTKIAFFFVLVSTQYRIFEHI